MSKIFREMRIENLNKDIEKLGKFILSNSIVIFLAKNPTTLRKAFVNQRKYYDDCLHKLEIQNLENISAKMKPLEAELDRAITLLNNALESVQNTVNIISGIQSVSNIVARIVPIFS